MFADEVGETPLLVSQNFPRPQTARTLDLISCFDGRAVALVV